MNYGVFKKIEKDYPLADFFNHVMGQLLWTRTFSAPSHFDAPATDEQKTVFYDFCLYETWMHEVVNKLIEWRKLINEYFSEYDGRWEYFATTMSLRDDEEERGELTEYSIMAYLYKEEWRDIVLDTVPSHVNTLCCYLVAFSKMDLMKGLKEHFGNVVSYMEGEDGTLREMTQEDCDLAMASRQVTADDDCTKLKAIAAGIFGIKTMISVCRKDDDNISQLQAIYNAVTALLSCDFRGLNDVIGQYSEKYMEGGS